MTLAPIAPQSSGAALNPYKTSMPTSPPGSLHATSSTIQADQGGRSRRRVSRDHAGGSRGDSAGATRDGDDDTSLRGGSNTDSRKGKKRKRVLTGKLNEQCSQNVGPNSAPISSRRVPDLPPAQGEMRRISSRLRTMLSSTIALRMG